MDLEVTSIEEVESRLISKPREEFLNYNFSVHGALPNPSSKQLVRDWYSIDFDMVVW